MSSIYQNHLILKGLPGHMGKLAVKDLIAKYGGDITIEAVGKAARCSRCTGKNITSAQIIYIGRSELAMSSAPTSKGK